MRENEIPVGTVTQNLIGQSFGKLTIMYRVKNPNGKADVYWHCKCECGNEKDIMGKNLRNGRTTSCVCQTKLNLKGQRFGKWIVLEEGPRTKNRSLTWKCQCDCGTISFVDGRHLKNGSSQSCGKCRTAHNIPDLIGKKFGKLTVIEQSEERQNQKVMWKCQCECGNITFVTTGNLNSGVTTSCGCQNSKGEDKVIEILLKNNIPFETQKTFESCRFPDTKYLAKFDFYVDNKYLIEYDGEQHFYYKSEGWNNQTAFEKTQERDKFKNQWCKEHNIPLIRIPYTIYSELKIDDLLLETSQYIIL